LDVFDAIKRRKKQKFNQESFHLGIYDKPKVEREEKGKRESQRRNKKLLNEIPRNVNLLTS
jgi:hypothetical protein